MDLTLILKYALVVLREIWSRKFLFLFGAAAIGFAVLIVGAFWPSKFETSAVIFADNQNILKPLLESQAAQSRVQNRSRIVRDMVHSPRLLQQVVEKVYDTSSFDSPEDMGAAINGLRSRIGVASLGASYIKITYNDDTAEDAYDILNTVIDTFIRSSSESQRTESREAFMFIDNQVKQYKDQLLLAEERLKEFKSTNFDGRSGSVDARISKLRDQIELLEIDVNEDRISIRELEEQLSKESEFTDVAMVSDAFMDRLRALQLRKENLLLSYTEDYPDVVSVQQQIDDIRESMKQNAEPKANKDSSDAQVLNPLYQELRSRLSVAKTNVETKTQRLVALKGLLEEEYERRKRIAERGAEEAELTRDYNVTKRIYEDMLARKEKARLSMTLNIEGQGVTYRVQEPPVMPLNPTGLRFVHFVLLGPLAGLLAIIGLVTAYILVDPRVRFSDKLVEMGLPVAAVVPHVTTPFGERIIKKDIVLCSILAILLIAGYIGLAFSIKTGYVL
ncbi:MAG: chain length-determining protein [Oleiphilus sp.]|nr:MAG: chain length-determining protein [Oleiphilus sp.]